MVSSKIACFLFPTVSTSGNLWVSSEFVLLITNQWLTVVTAEFKTLAMSDRDANLQLTGAVCIVVAQEACFKLFLLSQRQLALLMRIGILKAVFREGANQFLSQSDSGAPQQQGGGVSGLVVVARTATGTSGGVWDFWNCFLVCAGVC